MRSLIDFDDPGAFYDRRFLLPLRKALRTVAVDINAGEFLTVMVVDRYLPMAVLAPAILLELGRTPCLLFRHDG